MDHKKSIFKHISYPLIILFLSIPPPYVFAKTDLFLPDHEFVHSITTSPYTQHNIQQLFQNPSSLTNKRHRESLLILHNNNWGYKQTHAALIIPYKQFILGAGINYFGCSDIYQSNKAPINTKPTIDGTFSHSISTTELIIGTHYFFTNPSLKLTHIHQKIYNQTANGMSIDFGSQITLFRNIWIGAYTRYLNKPSLFWKTSDYTERKDTDIILESGLECDTISYRISTNKHYIHISTEWTYHTLALSADIVGKHHNKENNKGLYRYGFGITYPYKKLKIIYNYLTYKNNYLHEQKNQLGLAWTWH